MAFQILYKTLFQIQIYHSYFLNEGNTAFNDMDETEQKKQLKQYRFEDYLTIVPTAYTQKSLNDYKLSLKESRDTVSILVKAIEVEDNFQSERFLEDTLSLTFLIYTKDYLFDNYTILPKENHRLYYFSNVQPETEDVSFPAISLSSSTDEIDKIYLLSEATTQHTWYKIKQENAFAQNDAVSSLFAEIEDGEGFSEQEEKIIKDSIRAEQSKGLIGIIRLQMQGDDDLHLVNVDDSDPENIKTHLIDPIPIFKLHFENRKTIWKYIHRADEEELETTTVFPLTKNGFIAIDPDVDLVTPLPDDIDKYRFPNPTPDRIKQETDIDTDITTTYSEIFI